MIWLSVFNLKEKLEIREEKLVQVKQKNIYILFPLEYFGYWYIIFAYNYHYEYK